MDYLNNEDNSKEFELNEIIINLNENSSRKNSFNNLEKNEKVKRIFLDDNIISKIFFIWSIKSTYLEKSKDVKDYYFEYYPLINFPKQTNSKFFIFTFFSFYKKILGRNKFLIFITILLAILSGILDFVQYMIFKNFLSLIKEIKIYNDSYYYIFGLKYIFFKICQLIIINNLYFYENYLPIKISNEIINLIYYKVISLTEDHSKDKLLGKIINLIQTDVENISFIFNYGPRSLVVPIQIILVLYNVYQYYNDMFLLIILIIILSICFIIAFIIQKRYIISNTNYLHYKDIRIHSTNDILNNLKEIKMNNLENFFEKIIDNKRKLELYHYNSIMNQGIANVFLFDSMGDFMTIGLLIYVRFIIDRNNNNDLINEDIIITIILMFNKLAYPLYRFPVFVTGLIDCYVSRKRIIGFFNKTESFNQIYEKIDTENKNICILGPNGGGKTTFIKSLIKDKLSTKIKMSYCSQEKFILDNTIKENILFGNEFNKDKYLSVLEDCQLSKDINNFKEKDLKECKMNGIQLSGGQKSRVDLARAIYNDSQYYFFDDIFASYDDKVRLNIFNNIFIKKLKNENKNIIATFSNINFLDKNNLSIFDCFIIINNKKIIFKNDYETFIKSDYYSNISNNYKNNFINSNVEEKLQKIEEEKSQKEENQKYFESQIKKAMKEIGCYFCFGLIFYEIVYQIFELYKIKYILYNFKEFDSEGKKIIDYYLLICFINLFFNFMIKHTLYKATFYLNKNISKKILNKILSMPLFSFLQLSKSSDIINRLSRDIEKIKYPMKFLQYVLRDTLGVLIITIYCFNYEKLLLVFLIVNITLSFLLFIFFIDRAKLYNNLERDSHSPLINLFSESLVGDLYIQVYDKSSFFKNLLNKRMDNLLKMNIFKFGSMAMFQMYHELICILNLSLIIIYCIIYKYVNKEVDKENLSILLTYSINLIDTMSNLFHSLIDMSLNKIYFDRLLQYENTEKEKNLEKSPFSYGDIKFDNICMKYKKNSELVLKNINLEIKKGQKVAIIGRTGSGKSSLILCLLRILQNNELIKGKITINEIKIHNFDLNKLRKSISVVSQKPFIFNDCSLKENIDPDNIIKDDKILLNKIQKFNFMKNFITKYIHEKNDLEKKIIDLSLSEGEKQIICLCRIMIKNNKIIVMDEATSNIDLDTEKLIYDDFINLIPKDTTIFSILHKLEYIDYYDKIIEITDDGRIK